MPWSQQPLRLHLLLTPVPCMHRPSYLEGRLRLADKERQRKQSKAAAPAGEPPAPDRQALEAMEAQANANMVALLQEEASTKVGRSNGLEPAAWHTLRH